MKPIIINGPEHLTNQLINKLFSNFTQRKALLLDAFNHPFFEKLLSREIHQVLNYQVLFVKNYKAEHLTDDVVYPIADAKQLIIATNGHHSVTNAIRINIHNFSSWSGMCKLYMRDQYYNWIKAQLHKIAIPHYVNSEDGILLNKQYDTQISLAKENINNKIYQQQLKKAVWNAKLRKPILKDGGFLISKKSSVSKYNRIVL